MSATAITLAHAAILAHELLSLALFYSCFCRAVRMSQHTTKWDVLLAFYFLCVTAVVCIFAPLALAWQPTGVSLLLLLAIVVVQVVTARRWRDGPPIDFLRN